MLPRLETHEADKALQYYAPSSARSCTSLQLRLAIRRSRSFVLPPAHLGSSPSSSSSSSSPSRQQESIGEPGWQVLRGRSLEIRREKITLQFSPTTSTVCCGGNHILLARRQISFTASASRLYLPQAWCPICILVTIRLIVFIYRTCFTITQRLVTQN